MKKLNLEQIKDARVKTLQNAKDLIDDADILYKTNQSPRIIFLCQIAGEELGKYFILSNSALELIYKGSLNWNRFWKQLTSHKFKLKTITLMEDILLNRDPSKEYVPELQEQVRILEEGKQKSLYSDFTFGMCHHPREVVSKEMIEHCLKWAHGRLNLISNHEKIINDMGTLDKITKEDLEQISTKYNLKRFIEM